MQEILVDYSMVSPSISHVRPGSWEEVQKCADISLRYLLPPVILIEMIDHQFDLGNKLFDGNHRVLLTRAYGGFVRGLLFTVKEVLEINGKEHGLYTTSMQEIRNGMRRANKHGVYSFSDLLTQVSQT